MQLNTVSTQSLIILWPSIQTSRLDVDKIYGLPGWDNMTFLLFEDDGVLRASFTPFPTTALTKRSTLKSKFFYCLDTEFDKEMAIKKFHLAGQDANSALDIDISQTANMGALRLLIAGQLAIVEPEGNKCRLLLVDEEIQ